MTIDHDKRRVEIEGLLNDLPAGNFMADKLNGMSTVVYADQAEGVRGWVADHVEPRCARLLTNVQADLRYLLDDAIHADAEIERLKVLLDDVMRVLGRIKPDDIKGDPSWRAESEIMVSDYRADGDKMSTL